MTNGWPRRITTAAVVLITLGTLTSGLAAQTAPELSYLRALGDHYDLPTDEVQILAEWQIPIGELPVALAIADRAGISPDALVASRRNGRTWAALAARYGLGAGFFHVEFDTPPTSVASLYEQFETLPRARWSEIQVEDDDAVFLVNVRFLSEYVDRPPSDVATALLEHDSPAEALRAISP